MLTHRGADPWAESLFGLHVPAWWTGLRLTAAEGWNTVYRVCLRSRDRAGLPYQPQECAWTQVSGDWHPLPWALPASMASVMGLELLITPVDNAPPDLVTSVRIAFHELGQLSEQDRLIFCDDRGQPVHMWNGQQLLWGTPEEGERPDWREIHAIVPNMKWLLHMPWDNRYVRLNSWNDWIQLRHDDINAYRG